MKEQFVYLTLVCGFAVALAGCASATNPHDTKPVQGNWKAVQADLGGRSMPDAFVKSVRLNLAEGTWVVYVGEQPDNRQLASENRFISGDRKFRSDQIPL